ncbi:MAG: hypothetical protein Kow0088_26430 [Anaerolineales bacterium]
MKVSPTRSHQSSNPSYLSYPLLHKTVQAFMEHRGKSPQNPGLIFERFVPDTSHSSEVKLKALRQVKQASQKIDRELLQALNQRWEQLARALRACPFSLKTEWRLISGLGRKGPLEIGFTFNRFGFPILPSSSLKGVARAYALYQLAEACQVSDLQSLDALLSKEEKEFQKAFPEQIGIEREDALLLMKKFRTVFGTLSQAGGAVFLEGIPARKPDLEIDLMNPHYPEYYKGNEPPTNWQSPTPIYFLTVAAKTEFRFAVGWRGALDESLRQLAQDWLKNGLIELGAGAKTAAGYGYFVGEVSHPAPLATKETADGQTTQQLSTKSPAAAQTFTQSSTGKVKYESGKPFLVDDANPERILPLNWNELGMDALPAKSKVRYTYQVSPDGNYKVIAVQKKYGE